MIRISIPDALIVARRRVNRSRYSTLAKGGGTMGFSLSWLGERLLKVRNKVVRVFQSNRYSENSVAGIVAVDRKRWFREAKRFSCDLSRWIITNITMGF